MIAVAVIAITSALAVPAYQNYVVRAKVTEGLSYMNQYKNEIMEYFLFTGRFPAAISNLTNLNASGATVCTTRNYTCACVTNTGSVNTLGQENYSGGNPSGLCKSGSSYSPACTGGSVSSFVPYDAITHDSCTRSYSTTS